MNRFFAFAAAGAMLLGVYGQAQALPEPDMSPKYTYELKDVMKVDGRQGVACDGKYIYVSCSKVLYKYDMDGKLVLKNDKPFETGYTKAVNHLGDIDVYNGEIYCGVENFMDGVGKDIQVSVYDANTLKFKRAFPFNEASGQQETSGITVDPVKGTVWTTSRPHQGTRSRARSSTLSRAWGEV